MLASGMFALLFDSEDAACLGNTAGSVKGTCQSMALQRPCMCISQSLTCNQMHTVCLPYCDFASRNHSFLHSCWCCACYNLRPSSGIAQWQMETKL